MFRGALAQTELWVNSRRPLVSSCANYLSYLSALTPPPLALTALENFSIPVLFVPVTHPLFTSQLNALNVSFPQLRVCASGREMRFHVVLLKCKSSPAARSPGCGQKHLLTVDAQLHTALFMLMTRSSTSHPHSTLERD